MAMTWAREGETEDELWCGTNFFFFFFEQMPGSDA